MKKKEYDNEKIMKKNDKDFGGRAFLNALKPMKFRLGPLLATTAAFLISLAVISLNRGSARFGMEDIQEFEVGRVAERDVTAEQSVSYIDEEATTRSRESKEKQVPAVFTYLLEANEKIIESYNRFAAVLSSFFTGQDGENGSFTYFRSALEGEFPGSFSLSVLEALYNTPDREQAGEYGSVVLGQLLEAGIFAMPLGLEIYNPDIVELLHNYGPRTEREQIRYDRIITMDKAGAAITRLAEENGFPHSFTAVAVSLLMPFLTENVFFSPEDTQQRIAEVRSKVEPVVKYIERGKKVVRRGFVVTEGDMAQLRALSVTASGRDPRLGIGRALIFLLHYAFLGFLAGQRFQNRQLKPREVYLLCILAAAYITGSVFIRNLSIIGDFSAALFLPTALVIMLPYILIGPRIAVTMAMVLPLASFISGAFDASSYIFALTSGAAAVYTLRGVEKRIDMVKAGLAVGAANCAAILSVLLFQRSPPENYPGSLFWAAFNGAASGILVLGFLPWLEYVLNAVTSFRLIELADLNSPILKRLFSAAPGTYSHSLMVATLAETACQEIGANPLLARVGAYYHDIGKIDNPDYFVENQTAYNKHDNIAPRLSATVIRSHVKLGVEKARRLGLPKEVTDIIAEHHGNSVISWFYHEALKRENLVNQEDFSYPGVPPRSRESAVVMLADVTEAATRTLEKPSVTRLEKYIQELIMAKFEHGQLSESELTFRELETIKKAFVRVLAGHYHSRIEYPKIPKDLKTPEASKNGEGSKSPKESKGPGDSEDSKETPEPKQESKAGEPRNESQKTEDRNEPR
ncbi:MAG: HDIG domain-containing protein [Spirochaetaceae bacterium]|jgi:putative nucleotidyltransferase with HDIG domain|nr:HDIG domain-containing protein [Spirochaetaceae bacterium]